MSHAPPRAIDILRIATVLLLMALPSCRPDTVTAPTVTGVSFAKGGNGGGGPGPKVDATEPPAAPQDVTLDVRVLGQGFDEGSVAVWTIDGVGQPELQTNSTTFVSKDELVANITIQENAAVDLYDVEVTTSRGKKGIGADLFSVVKKGTPTFTTVELGPVEGSDNSLAWAVNDVGQVAGLSLADRGAYDDRPTRWHVDEASGLVTIQELAEKTDWFASQPTGISDAGIVSGGAVEDGTSKLKAVWWDIDGSANTFEPGAAANDVSSFDSGWIAVGRDDWTAVYWTDGGSPSPLQPVAPGASSVANAVNSAGTIAGRSGEDAVVWYRDGEGNYGLPCVLGTDAVAHGISGPTGEGLVYVAGNAYSDPVGAVWLIDPGAGTDCLVSVRRLDKSSELYDVSSGGDAVGEGWDSAHHAILWTSEGVFGLPGLNKGGKGARWARGISSDGRWIVGASDAPKNSGRGVLWIREH